MERKNNVNKEERDFCPLFNKHSEDEATEGKKRVIIPPIVKPSLKEISIVPAYYHR